MSTRALAVFGVLTASLGGCCPSSPREAVCGRWEAAGLCCEFTEDETVRIWGDFGQAVGIYAVEDDGCVRIHLYRHEQSELPVSLTASVSRNTLTLSAADRGRVKLRRR